MCLSCELPPRSEGPPVSPRQKEPQPPPVVTPDGLHGSAGQGQIALDSPAWFAWLDGSDAFVYKSTAGAFSVRRERRGAGAGFWRAAKKHAGRLRRIYLGQTQNLTAERLTRTAQLLFTAPPQLDTDEDPAGRRPAPSAWLRPPAVSGVIARPRLIQRLSAGAAQRLTIVIGPPGSGKTTLLATWSRHLQRQGARVAWVSLTAPLGSPQSFWAAALAACDLALGRRSRCLDGACTASRLVDSLGTNTKGLVLILDGYDAFQNPTIHAGLDALLAHPELPLRLVVAARSWPSLSLASLRAADALLEVLPAELAWNADEAASLLAKTLGRPPSDEELTTLLAASEGWLGGLRLATLALRDHTGTLTAVAAANGAHPYLAAYLRAEIVAPLPLGLQQTLRDAAPLQTLTVPLFAAAAECTLAEAGTALSALAQAVAMVTPLDLNGEAYQLHPQLSAAVRAQGAREDRSRQRGVQARAARWCAAHGQPERAISLALDADDVALAAELLAAHGTAQLLMGRVSTVGRWLDAIPLALRQSNPQLTVLAAWEAVLSARPHLAHTHAEAALALGSRLDDAELRAAVEGEALAARAIAFLAEHDLAAVVRYAAAAAHVLPASNRYLHGLLQRLCTLAPAKHAGIDPDLMRAFTQTAAAAEVGQELVLAVAAHSQAGDLARAQGALEAASLSYRQALRLADSAGRSPVAALALIGLGAIAYEQDRCDEAARFLQDGIVLAERGGLVTATAEGCFLLGRVELARGDCTSVATLTARLQELDDRLQLTAALRVRAAALAAEAALAGDESTIPFALLPTLLAGSTDGSDPSVLLTLVRALLRGGEAERARTLATAARVRVEEYHGGAIEVRARVAEALALDACGDQQTALDVLRVALQRAEREGALRGMLDGGPPVLPLLQAAHTAGFCRSFTVELIRRLGGALPSDLPLVVEPLTERERTILRLLAAGEPFGAIASTLGLSPSTVKWHAANLYSKLGVRSRAQAVARGRILMLL